MLGGFAWKHKMEEILDSHVFMTYSMDPDSEAEFFLSNVEVVLSFLPRIVTCINATNPHKTNESRGSGLRHRIVEHCTWALLFPSAESIPMQNCTAPFCPGWMQSSARGFSAEEGVSDLQCHWWSCGDVAEDLILVPNAWQKTLKCWPL